LTGLRGLVKIASTLTKEDLNMSKDDKKGFNTNTENHDEWLTPKYIIEALGVFDLDPCSPTPDTRPWDTADKHYSVIDDGLSHDWRGSRVWCNPPYGRETFKWLSKLAKETRGIALIFARTETIGFHEEIWNKAHAVFFFKGRLKFCKIDGTSGNTANAPSCLVAYGSEEVTAIQAAIDSSLIKGKLVRIK
jgi:hypothetical protein